MTDGHLKLLSPDQYSNNLGATGGKSRFSDFAGMYSLYSNEFSSMECNYIGGDLQVAACSLHGLTLRNNPSLQLHANRPWSASQVCPGDFVV